MNIDKRKSHLTLTQIVKLDKKRTERRILCKHCGHSVLIPEWENKKICSHCGNYVFKNDKEEFKYRIKERKLK